MQLTHSKHEPKKRPNYVRSTESFRLRTIFNLSNRVTSKPELWIKFHRDQITSGDLNMLIVITKSDTLNTSIG